VKLEKQKVVLITGGAGGVGLQTARRLVSDDPEIRLALLDHDRAALEKAVVGLASAGSVIALPVDVTDSASVDAAVRDASAKLGRITGLVTAAGIRQVSRPIIEVSDEDWKNLLNINLFGTFSVVRAVARAMIAAGGCGSIVTISSIGGTRARLGQSAYGASKAAVAQFTRTLALEMAQHKINANSICPGLINTEMFQLAQAQDGPEVTKARIWGMPERFRPGIPARRIAEPDEVANLICFLLSPGAQHISGQAIHIDGAESVL